MVDLDRTQTTRQHLRELLVHEKQSSLEDIVDYFDDVSNHTTLSEKEVLNHLENIKKSLRNEDMEMKAIPPQCNECDFKNFDKILNNPSQCPQCRSKRISGPVITIE